MSNASDRRARDVILSAMQEQMAHYSAGDKCFSRAFVLLTHEGRTPTQIDRVTKQIFDELRQFRSEKAA